ncbi:YveK family protein [Ectobacillus funiculus]|uniref:YveK family protein n=1 Tax=Ectobacillus funiculus TaxID=137993 RepID=UPI00101D32E9|nr:Wzz/FepE/Etk N-terminal domain-containing protein [Ectobacillus funiculus]
MEETISLKELFQILRKRLLMILAVTFTAVLASAIVSFYFITPIYQSSTQILVNQKKADNSIVQYNEVQTNLQLVNTYSVIIKSPAILDQVKKQLNLDMSVQELTNKINVASATDSQVFSVTVQDAKPELARDIANTTAAVFKEEVAKIMSVDNVSVLSTAEVTKDQSPIKPQPMLNIVIAFVIGLMVSIGLAFLLEYFDNTIKREQDIEKILELPVLGVVTKMEEKKAAAAAIAKVREQTIGS